MKQIFLKLLLGSGLLLFSLNVFAAPFTHAASTTGGSKDCRKEFLGFPHWYQYLEIDDQTCQITGPQNNDGSLDIFAVATRVILAVIDILMRVAGIVAFVFIVYSGFQFVLSQGDPAKEKEARETAQNAVIGLVITIFAITIITFVTKRLQS